MWPSTVTGKSYGILNNKQELRDPVPARIDERGSKMSKCQGRSYLSPPWPNHYKKHHMYKHVVFICTFKSGPIKSHSY